jgi:hypothetical protein
VTATAEVIARRRSGHPEPFAFAVRGARQLKRALLTLARSDESTNRRRNGTFAGTPLRRSPAHRNRMVLIR